LGEHFLDKELFYLDRVSFKYQDFQPVFNNLSIIIQKGESVSLLGANGSGKSTLLKILCALVFPSEGIFRAFGQVINEEAMENEAFSKEYHRRLGFIFQNSDVQLFTTRVWDEIAFGPLQLGWEQDRVREMVDDVINLLGIKHLKERSPYRLSGGEKKKVAVASVLVLNPQVLILPEEQQANEIIISSPHSFFVGLHHKKANSFVAPVPVFYTKHRHKNIGLF
jgi:cobalt/nickel transport system ATP-binding protein